MRNRSQKGFTLIELLIVIAIIGILAAVLIPNLLNARQRAFDTAAQTCLKEIATAEELEASTDPWNYSEHDFVSAGDAATAENGIESCTNVVVAEVVDGDNDGLSTYGYSARHNNGSTPGLFYIRNGGGVSTQVPTF